MTTRPYILLDSAKQLTTLTERQREVVALVCEGLSNKTMGRRLGVTEGTVKTHLNVIYEKLDVRSRAELIIRFGTPWRVAV
jgi:two-component system nitrate/nitrite response regulator NarL